jgi:lipoprotein LprG
VPYDPTVVVSRIWLVALIAVLGTLGSCSSSDSGAGGGERSVEELLGDAAAAMTDIESVAFTIEQSGASIFIDDAEQIGFLSADGQFASPSSAEALITVEAFGLTTTVGAVAIDGEVWITDPLSGAWTEAPENLTFDPATVFDAEAGLPALLAEAATTAEQVDDDAASEDEPEPKGLHHLRATVPAERVSVLTAGLVTEETDVDLWIDDATSRVSELRFDLPVDDGVSSWRMALSNYDAEVAIEPPELGAPG